MKSTLTVTLVASLAASACASHDQPVTDDSSILGGVPARGSQFDAIGVLYGVRPTGAAPICTGTLIGPHTVLTAAHCVRPKTAPFDIIDKFPVFFAVGYDSAAPKQTVRAIWGGFTTVEGHDVGIYQLEQAPAGVTPLTVADTALEADDVGRKLSIVGYGLQDSDDHFADFLTRRIARFSITSFEPQVLHDLFPAFDEFKSFMEDNAGKEFTDEQATVIYDHTILSANDVFVGSPDEAQTSYLDSGAPALDLGSGSLRVRGVNSRGYRADPTVTPTGTAVDLLPVGTVIAMTGAAGTMELIETSLADACRNVTTEGHCSANLAIRCATELDPPVLSLVECGDFGAVCAVNEAGVAGCDDAADE